MRKQAHGKVEWSITTFFYKHEAIEKVVVISWKYGVHKKEVVEIEMQ